MEDPYSDEFDEEDGGEFDEEINNQEREIWELRRQRELKKATEESPIRTRYNPKERGPPKGANAGRASRLRSSTAGRSSKTRSSSAGPTTGRLAGAHAAAERLTQTARSWVNRGGKEIHLARASVGDAALHAYGSLDGEGADLRAIELFERANRLPEDADHTAFGVSHEAMRKEEVRRGVAALREDFGLTHGGCAFDVMKDNGLYFSGIDNAVLRAAKQGYWREREEKTESVPKLMREDRLKTLQAGKQLESAGSSMRKQPVNVKTLEELWSTMPGDSAIRRQPEEHEAVFDFGDNRISMPRYFAEDLRYGEQKREAGQLLEVKSRFTPGGGAGIVTLTTHVPRRNCLPQAPDRLDAICDTAQFDIDAPKGDANKRGLMGTSYSHLHQTKRPPNSKEWLAWREVQAQRRLEAIKERQTAVVRARRGQWDQNKQEEQDEAEGQTTGFEDQAANEDDNGAVSSRAPGPAATAGTSPTAGSSPGSTTMRRRGGFDAQIAAQHTLLPWDARPPPNDEEMDRIAQKFLPHHVVEAHKRRAAKSPAQKEQPKELAWTLRAVGTVDFELEFTVRIDPEMVFNRIPAGGHGMQDDWDDDGQKSKQGSAPGDGDDWDDDVWKGVFEPVPKAKAQKACWRVCGC